jgi:lysophospholipase L1-like esterase
VKNIFAISACLLVELIASSSFAQKRIVVLGSSTAAGNGASVDSAWVARLQASFRKNTSDGVDTVIDNRAYPGYVTYKGLPTDYPMPADRTQWPPDPIRNVTWVLSQNPKPDIVILSYVSNDVNLYPNYSKKETMDNLRLMYQNYTAAGIRCFVTSTQPRNDMSDVQRIMLRELRDSITNSFKLNSIVFWDDLVTNDGLNRLRDQVNSGDGIHPNNLGHRLLFEKVQAKNIFLNVSEAPPPPPPNYITVPGTVEAENYAAMFGIQTENTSDAGGGGRTMAIGWIIM